MTRTRPERDGVARELSSTLALLLLLADRCNIDLPLSIQLKIQLNAEKYPAAIVRCPIVLTVSAGILLHIPPSSRTIFLANRVYRNAPSHQCTNFCTGAL